MKEGPIICTIIVIVSSLFLFLSSYIHNNEREEFQDICIPTATSILWRAMKYGSWF